MSAAALPPLPTPDKTSTGSGRPATPGPDKVGDSEFDSVSKQERQRLDRDPKPDSAQKPDAARAEKTQAARSPDSAPEAKQVEDKPVATSNGEVGETEAGLVSGAVAEAGLEPAPVFTFAELQNLVMPEQGFLPGGAGSTGMANASPGMAAPAIGLSPMTLAGTDAAPGLRAMIPGMSGKTARTGSDNAGRMLAEGMMAQLAGEAGKASDTGLAAMSGRQGGLDVAAQTQLINPGQKIPEAMIPLKGYATSVELPVGHAEWGDKLVGKLAWLTSQKMSVAEIHLTPPDMGPLEVRVQVQNDQANVTVHAANPAVRDQLELHSHRLRDMLSGQGLELQNFDVADSPGRGGAEADQQDGQFAGGGDGADGDVAELDLAEAAGSLDLAWRGEVDLYA